MSGMAQCTSLFKRQITAAHKIKSLKISGNQFYKVHISTVMFKPY